MTIRTAIAAAFLVSGMLAYADDVLSVHAPADVKLDTNPESAFWKGAKLVACYDSFAPAVEKFSAEAGCHGYTNLDEMLALHPSPTE